MTAMELIITTLFGMEALVSKEVKKLGYTVTEVTDGRVTFIGDESAIARCNLWVRCGERLLIKMGEATVTTFDELFEFTRQLPWEDWIEKEDAFPVKGYSLKSTLFSVPGCQSIIKKAVVSALEETYGQKWFPETGTLYQIEFSLIKDKLTLMIDTSGQPLHKRGYRRNSNRAPLKETIAAAIVTLTRFRYDGVFADPFCGSGTIPIEAGLIAKNIAPGIHRDFAAMRFPQISDKIWKNAKEEANSLIRQDSRLKILASDIDPEAIRLTTHNAKVAGVSDMMEITEKPMQEFFPSEAVGTICSNPPYGERLLDETACRLLYKEMGRHFRTDLPGWSVFVLTPEEKFEDYYGKFCDKKRKLYNGMIKCNLFQYFGEKIIKGGF
ncbi:MAG: class I SAM-dependent RNA methyltransferase [Clostridia bacterium]|nr:class I SAM-dependent RNA methyltransferase [Clostridia bacterium]